MTALYARDLYAMEAKKLNKQTKVAGNIIWTFWYERKGVTEQYISL